MAYGYNPRQFVSDYSDVSNIGSAMGNFLSNIPQILKQDEDYRVAKENAASTEAANDKAFQEMQQATEAFGLDPGIIRPPQRREDTDQYVSREIATLLTAAKGAGVDQQTMVEKISQLSGASQVPGVAQEQQGLEQLQQQQAGVNVRTDEYGQQHPQPQEQTQQDIQAVTGGQKPSLLDNLAINAGKFGQSDVQPDFQLPTPQQPQDMLSGLQVSSPVEQNVSPLRQQALDAGISGNELDMMLSDMQSGNLGIADFDEKIAKAKNAQAKKMAAERKLQEEKQEGQRRRLQGQIGKVPIYLDGQQVKMIDPNRDPFDYQIGSEPIQKKTTVEYTGTGRGAGAAQQIDKGKTLRALYSERRRLQDQKNKLVKAKELNPRLLEMGNVEAQQYQKEMDNINRMLGDVETNINQMQKSPQIKPDKMKDVKQRDISTEELKRQIKAKRPNATEEQINAFLKKIGRM